MPKINYLIGGESELVLLEILNNFDNRKIKKDDPKNGRGHVEAVTTWRFSQPHATPGII